jgi:predicted Zn finger-like uncharacterized protein
MITHCPSCHTHFRVHAEQLAARAGQVRCGKCNRVFDALEYLIEEVGAARELPAMQELAPKVAAVAAETVPELAPEADVGAKLHAPATAVSTDEDVETTQAEIGTFELAVHESAPEPREDVDVEPAYGANSFDFGPIAAADPARRARRWPWLLGALLLLLILLAQASYHYRSALLVLFPEAKPYAVTLCASLGCELSLPRRIEQMSIDASDLQADTANPNIMVLSATLRNRAVFEQQLPSLELTLTDAQDQPVVRRVLAPKDYIGKAADTQTGFAANSEIAIKLFIEGSQVKATGYRLYLFYP